MLGESSVVGAALISVSFSGEVCLALTVGFVLFRLKMSCCVESAEAIYANNLGTDPSAFLYSRCVNEQTHLGTTDGLRQWYKGVNF